ncbi:ionotropic receptor 21a-like [Palaemon carinicauda]|uniref:ionotropic receptor 21a-like n=1 Tax=Palaemon carinicauda TaxID=392227 RepID=UPI0035B63732
MYEESDSGNRHLPYGRDIDIIKTLSRVMNFSIIFMEPPKGERWGECTPNGSLTGMLGMVHRGEADMGATNLFMSITRVRHVDYTKPYDSELSCVLIQNEQPLPSWQGLAFPYQPWMWFSILVTLLVIGPVMYYLARASAKLGNEIKKFDSLSYCCYYVFGMHLNEPQDKIPRRIHTQVFIAFLWLYTMLITISYSTNLTAFLTVKKSPSGIETIAELPLSGMHVVGVDSYYQIMLESSPDPNLQAMANTYQIYDSQELYGKVLSGEAVYINNRGNMEYTILTKFTQRGSSPLRIMKECFASHPVAMALQDHSPLKKRIDQIISRLLYTGLVRKFFTEALRKAAASKEFLEDESDWQAVEFYPSQTNDGSGGKLVPMSLDHMQGLFFVATLGLSISVVVFAIEKLKV